MGKKKGGLPPKKYECGGLAFVYIFRETGACRKRGNEEFQFRLRRKEDAIHPRLLLFLLLCVSSSFPGKKERENRCRKTRYKNGGGRIFFTGNGVLGDHNRLNLFLWPRPKTSGVQGWELNSGKKGLTLASHKTMMTVILSQIESAKCALLKGSFSPSKKMHFWSHVRHPTLFSWSKGVLLLAEGEKLGKFEN